MFKPIIKRASAIAKVLCFALVLSGTFAPSAEAALRSCRADPIVWLSDGTKVQLTIELNTDADNVQSVVYSLHAPSGTSVRRIVYTGGALRAKERVVFYADMMPGTYQTDTVAYTNSHGVQVTTTTRAQFFEGTVSGLEGEHLVMNFAAP